MFALIFQESLTIIHVLWQLVSQVGAKVSKMGDFNRCLSRHKPCKPISLVKLHRASKA